MVNFKNIYKYLKKHFYLHIQYFYNPFQIYYNDSNNLYHVSINHEKFNIILFFNSNIFDTNTNILIIQ